METANDSVEVSGRHVQPLLQQYEYVFSLHVYLDSVSLYM